MIFFAIMFIHLIIINLTFQKQCFILSSQCSLPSSSSISPRSKTRTLLQISPLKKTWIFKNLWESGTRSLLSPMPSNPITNALNPKILLKISLLLIWPNHALPTEKISLQKARPQQQFLGMETGQIGMGRYLRHTTSLKSRRTTNGP